MRLPGLFTALIQMTFDAALDGNDEAMALCRRLDGEVMAIEFTELGGGLWIRPHANGIDVLNHWNGGASVTLKGSVPNLMFSALRHDAGLPKGLRIDGDAETGQLFQKLLARLDIDWEEKLSRFIGDTAAHRVAKMFREFRDWSKTGAEKFGENIKEYLQEETGDLPRRREVTEFLAAVDTLRNDTDRLDARLQRLFRQAAQRDIDLKG